jgi:hypothetical protein
MQQNVQPHGTERRRHPRTRADLGLRLGAPSGETPARVHDVSSSGIRCLTEVSLPVMTQVRVHLVLPAALGERHVVCDGVVVRSERTGRAAAFDTAIFFSDVAEADRTELESYVAGL